MQKANWMFHNTIETMLSGIMKRFGRTFWHEAVLNKRAWPNNNNKNLLATVKHGDGGIMVCGLKSLRDLFVQSSCFFLVMVQQRKGQVQNGGNF